MFLIRVRKHLRTAVLPRVAVDGSLLPPVREQQQGRTITFGAQRGGGW